jgi:hypothetical protein
MVHTRLRLISRMCRVLIRQALQSTFSDVKQVTRFQYSYLEDIRAQKHFSAGFGTISFCACCIFGESFDLKLSNRWAILADSVPRVVPL